jgi:hypothetical protein
MEGTMTRLALLERLRQVQQMPRYQGRDITTITAVLSNQALAKHVELCEEAAGAKPQTAGSEALSAGRSVSAGTRDKADG